MQYKKLSLALSAFFAFGLSGCWWMFMSTDYEGKHPELFTEAIHSLLGIVGYAECCDATIKIIEKDEYGRVLFSYAENKYDYFLLIAQKSDGAYVYYYPDFNFILRRWETSFSEQEILEFKDRNDWNKPLDESKFIKQKIVREKAKYRLNEKDGEKIFKEAIGYNGSKSVFRQCEYLTSDEYGKKLFHCLGVTPNRDGRVYLVVIINVDGSYDLATCFMKLTNYYSDYRNFQQDLKAFKELNNWSEPWAIPREQTKEAQ